MAIQSETIAHRELVQGGQTAMHSHAGGGGGYTPAIFYVQGNGSQSLSSASAAAVQFAGSAEISDSGYSLASHEVTIGAALDGKRVRVDFSLGGTGATNRVQLDLFLQRNGANVAEARNYAARNTTQNDGSVAGFWVGTVNTGDTIRLRYSRAGVNLTQLADATSLAIMTLD